MRRLTPRLFPRRPWRVAGDRPGPGELHDAAVASIFAQTTRIPDHVEGPDLDEAIAAARRRSIAEHPAGSALPSTFIGDET